MSKVILAVFLLPLLFACCDLFNVRDAEPPGNARSEYQVAVTPEQLIANLTTSLKEKNVQNYLSCIADSAFSGLIFRFYPSGESSARFPVLRDNWARRNEEQYANNLFPRIPADYAITLTLATPAPQRQGDSAFVTTKYTLNVPHSDPNNPKTFQGEMKLKMVVDSRLVWTIYSWQDVRNSDLPGWSDLKGLYY